MLLSQMLCNWKLLTYLMFVIIFLLMAEFMLKRKGSTHPQQRFMPEFWCPLCKLTRGKGWMACPVFLLRVLIFMAVPASWAWWLCDTGQAKRREN